MMTLLKVMICLAAITVSFPIWFPLIMSLFGMAMGVFGAAIGVLSAFFALMIVAGVLIFAFATPALVLLGAIAFVVYSKTKRAQPSA